MCVRGGGGGDLCFMPHFSSVLFPPSNPRFVRMTIWSQKLTLNDFQLLVTEYRHHPFVEVFMFLRILWLYPCVKYLIFKSWGNTLRFLQSQACLGNSFVVSSKVLWISCSALFWIKMPYGCLFINCLISSTQVLKL